MANCFGVAGMIWQIKVYLMAGSIFMAALDAAGLVLTVYAIFKVRIHAKEIREKNRAVSSQTEA